ncbi:MAG: hypothetical protein JST93_01335 [Acidobacteria bacterium]|nr:hypothetical protein [Acidobacteriota bacterium]
MKRLCLLMAIPFLTLSQPGPGPMTGRTVVETKGVITAVRLDMQTMPSLELRTAKGVEKVVLGSMRYLIEKDFNPKVGNTAVVKGFHVDGYLYARSIQVPEQRLSIELRDEHGRPLWRGMGKMKR